MDRNGSFNIADLVFSVREAEMDAELTNQGLSWSLRIAAIPMSVASTGSDEMWYPYVQHENLPLIATTGKSWKELLPVTSKFSRPEESVNCSFSVFSSSCPLNTSGLTINIGEANSLRIKWKGSTDIDFDDKYGENQPLHIDTIGTFRGINCQIDYADAEARLAKFIDTNDFVLTKQDNRCFFQARTRPCDQEQ